MPSQVQCANDASFLTEVLPKTGLRLDGRAASTRRILNFEFVNHGCVIATLGDTKVMGSCAVCTVFPHPEAPSAGKLKMSFSGIDVSPSPTLRIALDTLFRQSQTFDLEGFCSIPGEAVYEVSLGVSVLSDDGAVIDAGVAAVSAVLQTYRIQVSEHEKRALPLIQIPVSITFASVANTFVVDPLKAEEQVSDGSIWFAFNHHSDVMGIETDGCSLGNTAELSELISSAKQHVSEITSFIDDQVAQFLAT